LGKQPFDVEADAGADLTVRGESGNLHIWKQRMLHLYFKGVNSVLGL
jgi:hypothetical protein